MIVVGIEFLRSPSTVYHSAFMQANRVQWLNGFELWEKHQAAMQAELFFPKNFLLNGQDGPEGAQLVDGFPLGRGVGRGPKWRSNCRRSIIVTGEKVCINRAFPVLRKYNPLWFRSHLWLAWFAAKRW